jgi:HK97 family phage prohead protease
VFNQWTTIRSIFEGEFVERLAPGCFRKTLREQRHKIKVLFQHGRDPLIGEKPLGTVEHLAEDARGAAYSVALLDTAYVRELLPALEAGLYGASFRFRPLKQEVTEQPKASAHNRQALPEVTITEARVSEFGPVTFPAYDGATSGIRCLTDELAFDRLARADQLPELVAYADTVTARAGIAEASSFEQRLANVERLLAGPTPSTAPTPTLELWGVEGPAQELPEWYHPALGGGPRPAWLTGGAWGRS